MTRRPTLSTGPLCFEDTPRHWTSWINAEIAKNPGSRGYFVSVTFDQYHDRVFTRDAVSSLGSSAAITKSDVYAGLTRLLPPDMAARNFVGDVNRWYLRLLSALFGGRYGQHSSLHPKGVGFLDEPVFKHYRGPATKAARKSGDKFPNAHFLLVVRDHPRPGKSLGLVDEFERLRHGGALQMMWQKLNESGTLDVRDFDGSVRVLDYAAKTAKRNAAYRDNMIMLPFGSTTARTQAA